jgi:hypothetical protein
MAYILVLWVVFNLTFKKYNKDVGVYSFLAVNI